MITIIGASNRKGSLSLALANYYQQTLSKETTERVVVLSLEKIPHDWFFPAMYEKDKEAGSLSNIRQKYIIPATKFIFIVPEYLGGMPGALKLFLDALTVNDFEKTLPGKKAAIVGIGAGRSGNLRGMEHLTTVLNFTGITVLPNKLPISFIREQFDENQTLTSKETIEVIDKQLKEFLAF